MINSFDTDVALDVGINAAILYKNIQFWCEKNMTNETNFHDGYYWTYNSMAAFCKQFPYMSEKQIRKALSDLESKGYIKSANYNKVAYDRTKWYADLQKVSMQSDKREDSICPTGQMDLTERANGFDREGEPIPYINTDINPNDMDIYNVDRPQKKTRFVPPTVEEVQEYCWERQNNVDAVKFVNHYESNGWKVGRNPMKDWKAAVRTWEKNTFDRSVSNQNAPSSNPFTELKRMEGRA